MITRVFKALLTGVGCAAAGLIISCWLWSSPAPYENYAYQEFATPKPEQGFEYSVGYTGSQSFFWEEILESRDFKFSVLKERGETPQTRWGLLPAVSAQPYVAFDKPKKTGLYLMITSPMCEERADHYRQGYVSDFAPISRAFVAASRARGVDVAPVGEVAVFTTDTSSYLAVVRSYGLPYLLLSCATATLVAVSSGRRKEQPNQSPSQRASRAAQL